MCLRESPTMQDTNWPAQLQRPARILKFRIYKPDVAFCFGSEQQRRWSDCADAQVDLRLCCSHRHKAHFSHGLAHLHYTIWGISFTIHLTEIKSGGSHFWRRKNTTEKLWDGLSVFRKHWVRIETRWTVEYEYLLGQSRQSGLSMTISPLIGTVCVCIPICVICR